MVGPRALGAGHRDSMSRIEALGFRVMGVSENKGYLIRGPSNPMGPST